MVCEDGSEVPLEGDAPGKRTCGNAEETSPEKEFVVLEICGVVCRERWRVRDGKDVEDS